MDPAAYLARIGHPPVERADAATLASLHRAHLLAVPFENLDVHRRRPIVLDEAALVRKVVQERRGGFCYELNGAFAWLLRRVGFDVTFLSAGVARDGGDFGPEFDHMLLRVGTPSGDLLADVGFGDSHLLPLPFALDRVTEDPTGRYRLVAASERIVLEREVDGAWAAQFSFGLGPRALHEYADMCRFHQTSPESHFTRKRVVTVATPDGRVTLRDDRLIATERGVRTERALAPGEWEALLRERFGLVAGSNDVTRALR